MSREAVRKMYREWNYVLSRSESIETYNKAGDVVNHVEESSQDKESENQAKTRHISYRDRIISRANGKSDIVEHCTLPAPSEKVFTEVQERVLFLFSSKSKIRRFCRWLGRQELFQSLVLAAIVGSCFFLIVAPPYNDMPKEDILLPMPDGLADLFNSIFTFLFLAEFLVKVMAQGLLFTSQAYLREGWNILDTIVLVLGLIDESGVFKGNIGKIAKMARALRPLRLMMRIKAMRIIVNTLFGTLRPVLYVIEFILFDFLVFGLVGMGLYGGKFYHCSDPGTLGNVDCSGAFVDPSTLSGTIGVLFPRAWVRPAYNFDTFGNSILTLFRISMVGKTTDIINAAMAITNLDENPSTNYSTSNFLFFMVFISINSILGMNIFLG